MFADVTDYVLVKFLNLDVIGRWGSSLWYARGFGRLYFATVEWVVFRLCQNDSDDHDIGVRNWLMQPSEYLMTF
jgi:hypothetical protein